MEVINTPAHTFLRVAPQGFFCLALFLPRFWRSDSMVGCRELCKVRAWYSVRSGVIPQVIGVCLLTVQACVARCFQHDNMYV